MWKLATVTCMLVVSMLCGVQLEAQKVGLQNSRCEVGLRYQISYQPNWGDSHAVVVEVIPGSPADLAGLRPWDIIRTLNGRSTEEMTEEEINSALLDPAAGTIEMVVANFGYPNRKVSLRKKCIPSAALSEDDLAKAFAQYSVEDVSSRRFNMPFRYQSPAKVDFLKYRTFSISMKGALMDPVERELKQVMEQKGLRYQQKGGDLTLVVSHSLERNPEYREGTATGKEKDFHNYRVNSRSGEIQDYPFLSLNAPHFFGAFRLRMAVDIYDSATQGKVWSVVAEERLDEGFSTANYATAFMPLMMANFPFMNYILNPTYLLHKNSHRSIGIYQDSRDLQLVLWVDKDSPADRAGIRPGDRLVTINGLPLDSSVAKMTEAYHRFLKKSWTYRDEDTIFPSVDGFQQNMYWKVDKYLQVAETMQDPRLFGAFSYLFSHRTYVNSPIIKQIVVERERKNGQRDALLVAPDMVRKDYVTFF